MGENVEIICVDNLDFKIFVIWEKEISEEEVLNFVCCFFRVVFIIDLIYYILGVFICSVVLGCWKKWVFINFGLMNLVYI